MFSKILRSVFPFIILSAGGIGAWVLLNHKEAPRKFVAKKVVPIVKVIPVEEMNQTVPIETQGTTEANATYTISPQVGGKVVWINSDLKAGKRISKGAKLFEIESTDFELEVEQAKAELIEAQYNLELVQAQQKAAVLEREAYHRLNGSAVSEEELSPLAKYEPQIKSAEGALRSAEASVDIAELNLKRTRIYAPAGGYLNSVSVTVGQILTANNSVVELIQTKPITMTVSVSLSDLELISFEGSSRKSVQANSPAVISKKVGSVVHHWQGVVKRKLSELDSSNQGVQLIVEVDKVVSDNGMELPVSMFADVEIAGRFQNQVVAVPVDTIRNNSTVWVVDENNQITVKQVTVMKQTDQTSYVSDGLAPGENLVSSSLTAAVNGMIVQIFDDTGTTRIARGDIPASAERKY